MNSPNWLRAMMPDYVPEDEARKLILKAEELKQRNRAEKNQPISAIGILGLENCTGDLYEHHFKTLVNFFDPVRIAISKKYKSLGDYCWIPSESFCKSVFYGKSDGAIKPSDLLKIARDNYNFNGAKTNYPLCVFKAYVHLLKRVAWRRLEDNQHPEGLLIWRIKNLKELQMSFPISFLSEIEMIDLNDERCKPIKNGQ